MTDRALGAARSAEPEPGAPSEPGAANGPGNGSQAAMAASDPTRARWERELASVTRILAPYAFEHDGETYLRREAPEALSAIYRRLVSVGYARGWMP